MPPRLPDDQREAILAEVRAGGKSTREIGKNHGVSDTTVRNIAKQAGITDAFSREQTENATRARVADQAAQRAALAQLMLDDARRLRDRAWSEYTLVVGSSMGAEKVLLEQPPLNEVRQAYTAVGIAIDKHLTLVKHDSGDGTDHAKSLLGGLADALGAAARSLEAGSGPVEGD